MQMQPMAVAASRPSVGSQWAAIGLGRAFADALPAAYTAPMAVPSAFAEFCCELLSSLGSVRARRMFGGWGLSVDGITVAIVGDLGSGDKLWLKADTDTRAVFEAAGCERFTYPMRKGDTLVDRSMNYYCPPDDAMDASHAMAPWGRMALESALKARAATPAKAARARLATGRKAAKPGRRTQG